VVVVGAGIIGASVAARLAGAGVEVCLVDREGPAAGASSAGEGNVLVSDKRPGPELALALRGAELWRELADDAKSRRVEGLHSRFGAFEFETKGGLVVASSPDELECLRALALLQREEGAHVELVSETGLRGLEPALSPGLVGGAYYEQDCQVQPMLAVGFLLGEAAAQGGRVVPQVEVLGARHGRGGAVQALRTSRGWVEVGRWVINAAGAWAGEVARRLGGALPVKPRRGHVLVTEPLPPLISHKVYEAGYVSSVYEAAASWRCAAVIEATASGTMLLGSSRELAGFDNRPRSEIVASIAWRAVALVPGLAQARLMRAYVGFRPATPDNLPIIGADLAVGGLLHAAGHEGAGIGLALVTAELVEAVVFGRAPRLDLAPFAPGRFGSEEW
jgi:glycine/D-amino acid oxidase-like deaminating enzyme